MITYYYKFHFELIHLVGNEGKTMTLLIGNHFTAPVKWLHNFLEPRRKLVENKVRKIKVRSIPCYSTLYKFKKQGM